MKYRPVFGSWAAKPDYYTLTVREMKPASFTDDENIYILKSGSHLINEIIAVLRYLDQKGLYLKSSDIRNQNYKKPYQPVHR